MSYKEMAERTTILTVDCGSRGFGIDGPESDNDEKSVCIEDFSTHVSLISRFKQHGPEKVEPCDRYPFGADIERYALWKFLGMALSGNPTVLAMLFGPPVWADERGKQLQALAPYIVSKLASNAFLGYMTQQKGRLIDRGREVYVKQFGFDVKFAAHLIRLGLQGIDLMETGKMVIPIPEPENTFIRSIRAGKVSYDEVVKRSEHLETLLKVARDNSTLPEQPNREYVDVWMRSMYWDAWQSREYMTVLLHKKGTIQ